MSFQVRMVLKDRKKSKLMEEMIISTTTKSLPNPTFTPWKHYHNPIFTPTHKPHLQRCFSCTQIKTHRPSMAELESARAQIIELKAELHLERKLRKKVEAIAMRMEKSLIEERRTREAAERLCNELENRVSHHKVEVGRIEREMEEERRMLRVAEVIREERVQMKMEDAKLFYEESLKTKIVEQRDECRKTGEEDTAIKVAEESSSCNGERKRWVSENPHIKRGINGFVEFPRGLRPVGSNKSNHQHKNNNKIECQKAQLRILLKQRSVVLPNSLAIS